MFPGKPIVNLQPSDEQLEVISERIANYLKPAIRMEVNEQVRQLYAAASLLVRASKQPAAPLTTEEEEE